MKRGALVVNSHVVAVIENEWAQMIRNRVVIFTTFVPPFLFVGLALCILLLSSWLDEFNYPAIDQLSSTVVQSLGGELSTLSRSDAVRATLLNPFLILFEMLPIVVPLTVASYSIIGEKQNRSLEALLATPIKTWELLLAKALAAVIPGIAATWYSFAVFVLAARFTVSPVIYNDLILSPTWIITIVLLTPIFTLFAVSMGIIISSRVKDPQSAQQLGSLVVLPMVALMIGQILGAVNVNVSAVMGVAMVLGAIDVFLLALAVRLFRREYIFTGWR